jgi:regulatory protein YycI of two-component signal transduction system YycFG
MKTKKNFALLLVIVSSFLNIIEIKAEEPKSATVKLNIVLNPIQTIIVNTQQDVDLVYKTIDNYGEGVLTTIKDHLKIFSTGGFEVKVESDGDLRNGDGSNIISSSDIIILAEKGTDNKVENNVAGRVVLGGAETLINSDSGGRDLMYNITYNNKSGGEDKYINLNKNGGANTYSTQIT